MVSMDEGSDNWMAPEQAFIRYVCHDVMKNEPGAKRRSDENQLVDDDLPIIRPALLEYRAEKRLPFFLSLSLHM